MCKRGGVTMVEVLIAATLTTVVFGAVATLYVGTMTAGGRSMTQATTQARGASVLDQIENVVQQATLCTEVVTGPNEALRCILPSGGRDVNGDGLADVFSPATVCKRGGDRFTNGRRVWFYLSDASGEYGRDGTVLYRAERTDDSTPTTTDIVDVIVGGERSRVMVNGVEDFSLDVNTTLRMVSIEFSGRMVKESESSVAANTLDDVPEEKGSRFVAARKFTWRNSGS